MSKTRRRESAAGESTGQVLVAAVLRGVLRLTLQRTLRAGLPWEQQRSRMLKVTRLTLPPRGTRLQAGTCGGIPGEWAESRRAAQHSLTFLYLHGGGYCVGSPVTHRALTGHLAARCSARLFAADYRLAPEHPFPAASPVIYPVSLVQGKYQWLLALNPRGGVIHAYRACLLGHQPIDWSLLALSTLIIVALFLGGLYYFRRMEKVFADVV